MAYHAEEKETVRFDGIRGMFNTHAMNKSYARFRESMVSVFLKYVLIPYSC